MRKVCFFFFMEMELLVTGVLLYGGCLIDGLGHKNLEEVVLMGAVCLI